MPRKWELTAQVHEAALLLSQDATWEYTSEQIGVTCNTIGNWMLRPEFRALKDHYRSQIIDKLAEHLGDGIEEMVSLWRQMVRGEVDAKDRRLDRIGPIVTRYFLDSFAFAEDTDKKDSRSQMAVQFNVGVPGS